MSTCYAAYKSCGCMVAACVDESEYKKDTAKAVASWLRDGYRVERVDSDMVRATLRSCKCTKPVASDQGNLHL
jgi:hypothetical protein